MLGATTFVHGCRESVGDLKRRIEQRLPRNIAELRQFLAEEWESTPQSTCSSLADSMPDRMRAVIDVEGHKTGY